MPTIEQNVEAWDQQYNWEQAGEEWSSAWGSSSEQWRAAILPRLRPFFPASNILEVAPGFGRWTRFLLEPCTSIAIIDLSQKCIDSCRQRFAGDTRVEYICNDGRSLSMIEDGSIDFAFSFDSLVHAGLDVLTAYVEQLSQKLRPDGAAFLHHSNLGAFPLYTTLHAHPKAWSFLARCGLAEGENGWRDPTMSGAAMLALARSNSLRCIRQERVNWHTKGLLSDAFSTLVRQGSKFDTGTELVVDNFDFMTEAAIVKRLSQIYG